LGVHCGGGGGGTMKAAYRQLAVAHHLQCALLGLPQPLKVQILGALWAPPRNLPVPHACARPSSLLPPPLTRRGVRLPASPVAQGTAGCCTAVGTASGCGAASAPAAAAALPLIQPIALQQALRPTAAGGRAQCRGSCCWPGSQAHALKAGRGGRGGGGGVAGGGHGEGQRGTPASKQASKQHKCGGALTAACTAARLLHPYSSSLLLASVLLPPAQSMCCGPCCGTQAWRSPVTCLPPPPACPSPSSAHLSQVS
jgi:hypothetical protein